MSDHAEPGPIPVMFPVRMTDDERTRYALCPKAVPFDLLLPFEKAAKKQFGGSLVHLAHDGGLDPVELESLIAGRPPPKPVQIAANFDQLMKQAAIAIASFVTRNRAAVDGTVTARAAWVWSCPFCAADNVVTPGSGPRARCMICKTHYRVVRPGVAGGSDGRGGAREEGRAG